MSILVGCTSKDVSGNVEEKDLVEIVDMANRTVMVPKKVEKILSTGSVGTILIYSINPDKMVGWNYELREGGEAIYKRKVSQFT